MKMKTDSSVTIDLKKAIAIDGSPPRWSGEFDVVELRRPGGPLIAALVQCAKERFLLKKDLALKLGVTYGYINQLRNGFRPVKCISEKFSSACARFLGVPRMRVLVFAGIVTIDDLSEYKSMLATEVHRAMDFICAAPSWGPQMTHEIRQSDELSLFGVVKLFEAATGKVLLSASLTAENLLEELEVLKSLQAYRALKVEEYKAKKRRFRD
jgi:hypothetical protein